MEIGSVGWQQEEGRKGRKGRMRWGEGLGGRLITDAGFVFTICIFGDGMASFSAGE